MDVPIRVIIVDDHAHIHELINLALHSLTDIIVVGEAYQGAEALMLCQELVPDVVLMDVVMPHMDGVEATRHLHELYPQTKILVLSSFQGDENVRAMLHAGAAGYLLKTAIAQDLASMIRSVYRGGAVFSREVADQLLQTKAPALPSQNFKLTERELEILALMVSGQNNIEIADQLFISQSTVKFHLTNILQKLNVETRTEAIVLAVKQQLI